MLVLGLIREGKIPADNRVALTPAQCKFLTSHFPDIQIKVQASPTRCFSNQEYQQAGIEITEDLGNCDLLLGIKEIPISQLICNKTYLFFSHTKKKQPNNQSLLHAMMDKEITLIDYECLEHKDGQRIIGFGFFAGIVGAHNGIMTYGNRTGAYQIGRVGDVKDYRELIHTYFGLKLPPIKIAITGSGRVAHGIVEVMNLMDVQEVELEEYLEREFDYPVYTHLKGNDLYRHKIKGNYSRTYFHENPQEFECLFAPYLSQTDLLMNGIYWEPRIPRLFEMEDLAKANFRIQVIADITDDKNGSIPCNMGDASFENPIYGINKLTGAKTAPYLPNSIDLMAVGNLPNELPRDASQFFGEQLIKHVLQDIKNGGSVTIANATILQQGQLTAAFQYLADYAAH
jgi:alanine dehydrogenase